MKILVKLSLVSTSLLLTNACTSSTPTVPDTPSFKQGNHDGCTTAKGEYSKNSHLFNNDADYQNGWFYGRKHCNPSQAQ